MWKQHLISSCLWRITNTVLNKRKSVIPSLFNGLEVLSSFLRTLFLILYSVTPRMVKKVITKLNLSKVSGTDCVPVVVLTNFQPELSCIVGELFNMCLKESCFQIVGSSLWCFLYLRILGQSLLLKGTTLFVFFLWLVKSLKNLQLIGLLISQINVAFF